jgi:hypothetical protein
MTVRIRPKHLIDEDTIGDFLPYEERADGFSRPPRQTLRGTEPPPGDEDFEMDPGIMEPFPYQEVSMQDPRLLALEQMMQQQRSVPMPRPRMPEMDQSNPMSPRPMDVDEITNQGATFTANDIDRMKSNGMTDEEIMQLVQSGMFEDLALDEPNTEDDLRKGR